MVFHIETNHLIYGAIQMTSFFMRYNTGLKWFNLANVDPVHRQVLYLCQFNSARWFSQCQWNTNVTKINKLA